jgi:hypothetical protein
MGIGEATADALLNNEFSLDFAFRRGNGGDASLGGTVRQEMQERRRGSLALDHGSRWTSGTVLFALPKIHLTPKIKFI